MSAKTPYPFTPETVQAIVVAVTTSPRFYQSVGHALDCDRVVPAEASALVWGAQQVATTRGGEGCVDFLLALQEIETAIAGGRVAQGTYDAACAYLDGALVNGVPDMDVLVAQVTPTVQYTMLRDDADKLLQKLAATSPTNGPMISQVAKDMATAFEKTVELSEDRNGIIVQEGTDDPDDILAAINGSSGGILLPTGVPAVDIALGGGTESRTFNLFLGGTGVGKTGYLVQQFCEGIINGFEGLYVSFELHASEIRSKVYRNLIAMTRDEVRANPQEAASRMKWWKENGLARFWVVKMPAGTPARRVFREISRLTRDENANIRVLALDYLDKMVGGQGTAWEDVEYMADKFRDEFSQVTDGWAFSGSQLVKGKSGAQTRLTVDDARGGAGKVNGADVVLAGQRLEEDKLHDTLRFEVLKRRIGSGEEAGVIGPLARDVERGRLVSIQRNTPWEANAVNVGPAFDPTAGLVEAPVGIPLSAVCPVCSDRLYMTPSGPSCRAGHGGVV